MEFTRHRRNLDVADHPSSDSYGFHEIDQDQDFHHLVDEYQAAGHEAFANSAAGRQELAIDPEYDDYDLGSEGLGSPSLGLWADEEDSADQDSGTERAVSLDLDAAAATALWPAVLLSPPHPDSESGSDSDSPASHQSRSSTEPASPGADSTASDDSLFVTQEGDEDDDEDFLAHAYVHQQLEGLAQHAPIFPYPHDHGERLRQSMANLHRRERDIQPYHQPSFANPSR